jgi:hypothetical protein
MPPEMIGNSIGRQLRVQGNLSENLIKKSDYPIAMFRPEGMVRDFSYYPDTRSVTKLHRAVLMLCRFSAGRVARAVFCEHRRKVATEGDVLDANRHHRRLGIALRNARRSSVDG